MTVTAVLTLSISAVLSAECPRGIVSMAESYVPIVISVATFALAAALAISAHINRRRDIAFDVAPRAYERYYEMNRIELDYPHLTHMFVTDDKYEMIKPIVRRSIIGLDTAKASTYILQERAVADLIFSYYEQSLAQWKGAKVKERVFVKEIIDYFEGRLLRNPRLVWWWKEELGGLETSYEKSTKDQLKLVYENIDFDSEGPFVPEAGGR